MKMGIGNAIVFTIVTTITAIMANVGVNAGDATTHTHTSTGRIRTVVTVNSMIRMNTCILARMITIVKVIIMSIKRNLQSPTQCL